MSGNRDYCLTTLKKNYPKIQSFGVTRLGLFGSMARDEATPESDLDFVVEFNIKTFDAFMDLKIFLEELFQRRVDLVTTEGLKPRLRPKILGEAIYVS